MPAAAIQLHGIHKTYPGRGAVPPVHALRGIDLEVDSGAVFCILGPNGAGKTTLIAILAGLLYHDEGRGYVCGFEISRNRRGIREVVNFASGHSNLPDNFTVDETLNYFGMLYDLAKSERIRQTERLTEFFELGAYRKIPFNQLSTGLKQRLALAKSLINDPRMLFLDEPTVGLDPKVSRLIRERLKKLNRERQTTLILTTHQMDEAEQMSDRIGFLKDGRFIRIASVAELKRSVRLQERITIRGRNLGVAVDRLQGIAGVSCTLLSDRQMNCQVDSREKRLHSILQLLLRAGAWIEDISIAQATLGDVFVKLAESSDSD